MDPDGDDPSTQVLVWDCTRHRKLKMPIGELCDKVGPENVKQEHIPKKGRVSIQGAIFDLSILLRIQRVFGRYRTLYIVGAS